MSNNLLHRGLQTAVRVARRILRRGSTHVPFNEAREYWERRYAGGGNSGPGSYSHLAEFKARFLNAFVEQHNITSVMEFGCGDGNQLSLATYPRYVGLDVSHSALRRCIQAFSDVSTYSFFLYDSRSFVDRDRRFHADLTMSLDVVYHLVEDEVFDAYIRHLFAAADRFVIIYSSNKDEPVNVYIRHRCVTDAVARLAPGWTLKERVPNEFPYVGDHDAQSWADFFVFERA